MLVSATIALRATADGTIHGSTGRAVHGFWFQQWRHVAPDTADALHDPGHAQPFTLSPLRDLPRPQRATTTIPRATAAHLRITTLEQNLSQRFLESWLPRLPGRLTLAGIDWEVERIGLAPADHPAAGRDTYARLLDAATRHPASRWAVAFDTPATFHVSSDAYLPFPLPAMLIKSWLRRWNAFAPVPLPWLDETELRDGLMISAYRLKTVPVRHGRAVTIGCVGDLALNGRTLSPAARTAVTALAAYARFCGTGHHTTRGMGQTCPQGPTALAGTPAADR